MTRQSRTIDASAKMSGSNAARALSRLSRVINVGRESGIARAAASIARSGVYRLQVPSSGSLLKDKQVLETGFIREGRIASDGSGSASGGELGRSETDNRIKAARADSGWHRATAMVNAGARVFRQIPEMSRASTTETTSGARKHVAQILASNTNPSRRERESHETRRLSFADAGVLAKVRVAPSNGGVMPPPGVSQREFAPPSSEVRVSNDGNGRAAITINSSPTVVINAAAGGAVQQDVIGALRAHREELFDQLKRESARRERAQF
jgi:hypothetical protein